MHKTELEKADSAIIHFVRKVSFPIAHIAIFVVFFWFGILKIVAESPANPLISDLLEKTLPFITFDQFIILFGIYEMIIGVAFLIRGLERLAILLLIPHMITTVLPLILLPAVTWQSWLVPTLEGQYIIKNIVIIALALSLAAHLHPMHLSHKNSK
jgi:uncharacterized membrane protein YkgB